MREEQDGQKFGRACWKEGLSVNETLEKAAVKCGLAKLPKDPTKWPKFIHGAEEAWQDKNLAFLDEQKSLSTIKDKHLNKA